MLLSIDMIKHDLPYYITHWQFHGYETRLNLQKCAVLRNDLRLRRDIVYLASEEFVSLSQLNVLDYEDGTAVIYLGDYHDDVLPDNVSFLFVKKGNVVFFDLVNAVIDIFERYHGIHEKLKTAICERYTLQQLVDIMTPVFDNELTIRNDEYQYIATSYPILKVNELREIPQPDEHGFFSTEDVNLLQSNPQYIQAQQMSEPQLYQDDSISIATYYYDIFVHQHFIYRLKISATNHPFRSYDKALLLYFSKFILQHYNLMLNSEFSSDTTSLRRVFLNLLQDETSYTEAALELKLKKENWTLHHRFICICLEADTHSWQQHNYSYYAKTLFKMFPAMYSFEYDNNIVCVVNLDTEYQGNITKLKEDIIYFLREENFRAGFSEIITNIRELKYYYNTAKFALMLGREYNPSIWTHDFKDYVFHYISKKISEDFPNGLFLIKPLLQLKKYDEEKQTQLILTLKTYLESQQNNTVASKKLFIHRTTLNYRLEKIRALTNLDLENRNTVLLLELGFRFLEL